MSIDATVLNQLFSGKLETAEGKSKIAELGGVYIRDRLREAAFSRQVLPPEVVSRQDCQRSVNHDTLTKIIDVEPQSRAMAITFRGQPTARFIRAARAEIPFYTISSEKFEKTEQELLAYEMPITKIIEDNSVKDIQEIEDRNFLIHIEAAVQAIQLEANGGVATSLSSLTVQAGSVTESAVRKGELARAATGTPDAVVRPLQRPDVVNLCKLLDGNRLRSERLLMTEVEFDDILMWTVEDLGDRVESETAVDGWKYTNLLGKGFIRTVKTDVLRPGNVYVFTSPEFMGKFYVLNQLKFYIDKIANMVTWQSWEDIAIGIVNIASVRKLELYAADANPSTDTQSLLSNFIPVEEDELGAENNRVDSGLFYPQHQSW